MTQTIEFAHPHRDAEYVSMFSRSVLKHAMMHCGVHRIIITSTYRSQTDQARVMLQNLSPGGGSMYRGPGQAVEAVGKKFATERAVIQSGLTSGFDPAKPLRKYSQTQEEVADLMVLKIHAQERHEGVGCVSQHQQDPRILNVIDIDPAHVAPKGHLLSFIRTLTHMPEIKRIGLPGGVKSFSDKHFRESVRCLHVEIPQPGEFDINGSVSSTV